MDDFYLLVGLGNPGASYQNSRHNLGFMIINELTRDLKKARNLDLPSLNGLEFGLDRRKVVFAKPLTFMNRSGQAVADLVEAYNAPLSHLLVILDDFNLPFGKLRLRPNGSAGGHNGLQSVIDELQTTNFPRLRVGVGQDGMEDPVEFVLGSFDAEETKLLPEVIQKASKACLAFIQDGIATTMNQFN